MLGRIEALYEGVRGRFLRAALATAAGVVASKYSQNEWYISLAPFLQLIGKKLRDKYPGRFDWLPI